MFQFYTDGGRCKGMQRSCFIRLIFVGLVIVSLQAKSQPPELQLANRYHPDITLQHYWISEKLDGVRAYWDGSTLVSKRGNTYHAPAWFTAGFPDFPLDGELWLARNTFEKLSGISSNNSQKKRTPSNHANDSPGEIPPNMGDLKEMAQSYMSKMTPDQIKELGKTVSNMSEEERKNMLKNFSQQFFKNKP